MDDVEVSLVFHVPPEEAYDVLVDYEGYPRHSKYVENVDIRGEGTGTPFAITLAWWRLRYTIRGQVTDAKRPEYIDFRISRDVHARGRWTLEPVEPPADVEAATSARLRIEFDRSTADPGLRLPGPKTLGWVVRRVTPLVEPEARKIVRRVVADVEGERRSVELSVHTRPDSI